MRRSTLFGFGLVVAMLAATAFAEEQKHDDRNNKDSPQYLEYATLQLNLSRAQLTFPEYGVAIINLLVVKRQTNPACCTDEVAAALRDCEKLFIRADRYEDVAVDLMNDKNLLNEPEKLAECREYIAKLTDCAKKFGSPWTVLIGAVAAEQEKSADEWKAAADEVAKEDAAAAGTGQNKGEQK